MITKLSGSVRPLFCLPLQPVDLENSPHQQQGASPFFGGFIDVLRFVLVF
jgi:hypothetical protein